MLLHLDGEKRRRGLRGGEDLVIYPGDTLVGTDHRCHLLVLQVPTSNGRTGILGSSVVICSVGSSPALHPFCFSHLKLAAACEPRSIHCKIEKSWPFLANARGFTRQHALARESL